LDGGRPAVSFFFILSGFVLNHKYPRLHWKDMAAAKQYSKSRFSRLYRTLVLALAMALPAGIFLVITNGSGQLLKFYALKDRYSLWLILSAFAQLTGLTGWIPVAAINQPWNGSRMEPDLRKGGPLGIGFQEQISNHSKLLR